MKFFYAFKERAPIFIELAWRISESRRLSLDQRQSRKFCEGRRMRVAATMIAVLVGIIVMVTSMSEMYDKCGPLCWQGLLQAQRERD
jgi:DMSO/TMAO reductase YedYZ heme-binding membrane subunit